MGARDQIEHSMSERKAAAGAAFADNKGLNHARSAKQGEMNALERDEHDDLTGDGTEVPSKSPRKRRKVNHACLYCRRSHMTCDLERPCTRCIKRNIGHLCHDEPRDTDFKKRKKPSATRSQDKGKGTAAADESDDMASSIPSTMGPPPPTFSGTGQRDDSGFQAGDMLRQSNPLGLVPPDAPSSLQPGALSHSANVNQFAGFSDAWLTAQNFQDMNTYNPNYMIGPEVTHEFNLLNEILHSSLPDDGGIAPDETQNVALARPGTSSDMLPPSFVNMPGLSAHDSLPAVQVQGGGSMLPPPPHVETSSSSHKNNNNNNNNIPGSSNNIKAKQGRVSDKDKTREYYLQAADPSGDDNPEERMARVLKAKYEAGLLKPFNYINGYARLGKYLDGHIAPSSKQKILRTINQFRPKFREKAQALTDMQLVYVEMWFEKQLMDYDRVFASMAVPACCWRRTGEIFRGNKEMAELINVPVDQLRDGKIALHEILTEESLVRYWEEFGTIAFDPAHDTLLTACSLKNPSDTSNHPIVKSCFSFTIRRDEHKLPALIVGNFLPHDPPPQ